MELAPWEGLSEEDVARLYPDEWQILQKTPAKLSMPGRETLDKLLKRILTGIKDIYQNNVDRSIIIITHVAVIRLLRLWHSKISLNLYKIVLATSAQLFQIKMDTAPVF